jgi:hypothetical protein
MIYNNEKLSASNPTLYDNHDVGFKNKLNGMILTYIAFKDSKFTVILKL